MADDFLSNPTGPDTGASPAPSGRIDVYKGETPATQPTQPGATPSFMDDPHGEAPPPQSPGTGHGYAETAALHGIHGLTSGFSDELAGLKGASGIAEDSPEWMPPLPEQAVRGLARMGYQKLISGDKSASEAYTKARDAHRKALEESAAENPITSGVSDVAGSLVLPGGAELRGATMGERALRGAFFSGAQGAARGAGEAQEMEDLPKGIVSGGAMGAVLGAPVNAVFGPRVVSAAQQAVIDAANKYGVQLPRYMTSEHPAIQAIGENLSSLPGVGQSLKAAGQKAVEGIENIRSGITGPGTPSELRTNASLAARKAYEDFVAASKAQSQQNYNNVLTAMTNPTAKIAPLSLWREVGEQIKDLAARGAEPVGVLKKAADALGVKGGLDYKALKNLRTDLYQNYRTMEGKAGIQFANYSKLLAATSSDMEDVVNRYGGQKAVALWKKANSQYSAGKDISKELTQAIGKPSNIQTSEADAIIRNIGSKKPDISSINTLRNTMRPADWEKIQGSVLGSMGSNEAGGFSLQKLMTADNNMIPAGRDAIFGMPGTPKRDAYDAIVKLGKAVTNVDQFRNTSRTGPYVTGAFILMGGIEDWREGNVSGTVSQVGAGLLASAILSRPTTARSATAFSRAMTNYLGKPEAWASGVPRAVETAARNFAITMANQTGMDKDQLIDAFTAATPMWSQ